MSTKQTKDLTFYEYVDPTDVGIKDVNSFIATKNKKDTMQILSPPMQILWPNVQGESKLGSEFVARGKTVRNTDRTKIKFSYNVTMGMAGMDDEIREFDPKLIEKQREFMTKVYQIGRNSLGAIYDARPDDFLTYILAAESDVLDYELQLHQDQDKSEWKSVDDLEAAMATDSELNDRIRAKQREKFITKAQYAFPNPADYDTEGNILKRGKDNKNKAIMVSANRKVWRRQKHLRTSKTMKQVAD